MPRKMKGTNVHNEHKRFNIFLILNQKSKMLYLTGNYGSQIYR